MGRGLSILVWGPVCSRARGWPMTIVKLLCQIIQRLCQPAAILEDDGSVACANARFKTLYNPLNDPAKTKPCSDLLQLHRKTRGSTRDVVAEQLILGPLRKKFDIFLYPLEQFKSNCRGALVLVREEGPEAQGSGFEMSERLSNSFMSASKVFAEDLDRAFDGIAGQDVTLRLALLSAQKAAKTDLPILIVGESGTGKELLARAIHRSSLRENGPFLAVNCAAIPENLIESELFGYAKGAFTGARREGKRGLFDQADGGTIFLDEIGDASFSVQSKLLRVLQDGEFLRVGGTTSVRVDVRIISATNKELDSLVRQTRFRDDLFYRLNTVAITLPPLRKRGSDIRFLARSFLEGHSGGNKQPLYFAEETLRTMESYAWPGNIRELRSVVDYAATMSDFEKIGPESLPLSMFLDKSLSSQEKDLSEALQSSFANGRFLPTLVENVEKTVFRKAIEMSHTRSQAIRLLGISRRTFYKKLRQYELEVNAPE